MTEAEALAIAVIAGVPIAVFIYCWHVWKYRREE